MKRGSAAVAKPRPSKAFQAVGVPWAQASRTSPRLGITQKSRSRTSIARPVTSGSRSASTPAPVSAIDAATTKRWAVASRGADGVMAPTGITLTGMLRPSAEG
jgi:hypothetical protein